MEAKSSKVALPPVNGKKMWRVKRSVPRSLSDSSTVNSNECLMNSLKISAACNQFTLKRFPLKRPKNKPGKPKDFVFVDLSPIKTENELLPSSDYDSGSDIQMPSPSSSLDESRLYDTQQFNESVSSVCSEDDSVFSSSDSNFSNDSSHFLFENPIANYMQSDAPVSMMDEPLGLGITGIDWNAGSFYPQQFHNDYTQQLYNSNDLLVNEHSVSGLQQHTPRSSIDMDQAMRGKQIAQPLGEQSVSAAGLPSPTESESKFNGVAKRSESTGDVRPKKKQGCFQFKVYNGPGKNNSKSSPKQRNSESSRGKSSGISKPSVNSPKTYGLEDIMLLNNQIEVNLRRDHKEPVQKNVQEADSYKPVNLDMDFLGSCNNDHFMTQIPDDFDLNLFVSI